MTEPEDLDDILNGTEPEPEAPAPEPEAPASQPRDEHGRFAPKGETPAEEPVASASPAPKIEEPPLEHPALLGERRRRQEAEQRLAELEARLNQQPAAPLPSVFEDEDAYTQQLIARARQEALAELTPQLQAQQKAMLIEMKRETYRAKHEDFTALEAELFEEMGKNPALAQQVAAADDPVEFGYRYMKNAKQVQTLGTLDIEQIRQKIRAELQAEAAAQVQATLQSAAPPTLAGERNVGARSGPAWSGPAPLSDLLS